MIIALPPHYKPPEVKKSGRGGSKGEMGAHCSSVRNLSIVETSYHSLKYNFSSSSPLSQHFAYVAEEGEKRFVVLNGVEQRKYDLVKNLSFTSDSQFIVYNARDGRDLWIIVEEIK